MQHSVHVLLLAAGESRRFGHDKLRRELCGRPLIHYCAMASLSSRASGVLAVVRNAETASLLPDSIHAVQCEGALSDSIRKGVEALLNRSCALILLLADQPFVTSAMIDQLIFMHERSDGECISFAVRGEARNPALFPSSMYPSLMQLRGDRGARELLKCASKIECDEQLLSDVDTEEDLIAASLRMCG